MAEYDSHTALVVVDVQNDFADPNGSLYVREGEQVVPVANREASRAATADALVVYTQDWHPPATPHFTTQGGVWPPHCVQGSWGADLHPQLRRTAGSQVLQKGTGGEDGYSAFTVRDPTSGDTEATALDAMLQARDVRTVVVLGLAADVCVKATALDAVKNGYATTVLREGTRGVELQEGDVERAFAELRDAGVELE